MNNLELSIINKHLKIESALEDPFKSTCEYLNVPYPSYCNKHGIETTHELCPTCYNEDKQRLSLFRKELKDLLTKYDAEIEACTGLYDDTDMYISIGTYHEDIIGSIITKDL